MYFWNIEKLKEELANNTLSEKAKFIYLLINGILYTIGLEVMTYLPIENPNLLDYTNSCLTVLISCVGTYAVFFSNKGSKGEFFIERFISISFVVTIRIIPLFIILFLFLGLYYFYTFTEDLYVGTTIIEIIPLLIIEILLYWRVCKHIKDINKF